MSLIGDRCKECNYYFLQEFFLWLHTHIIQNDRSHPYSEFLASSCVYIQMWGGWGGGGGGGILMHTHTYTYTHTHWSILAAKELLCMHHDIQRKKKMFCFHHCVVASIATTQLIKIQLVLITTPIYLN